MIVMKASYIAFMCSLEGYDLPGFILSSSLHVPVVVLLVQVYFSGIGRLKNVKAAVRRGRYLRCSRCNHPGATIGCRVDRCPQNFHLVSSTEAFLNNFILFYVILCFGIENVD